MPLVLLPLYIPRHLHKLNMKMTFSITIIWYCLALTLCVLVGTCQSFSSDHRRSRIHHSRRSQQRHENPHPSSNKSAPRLFVAFPFPVDDSKSEDESSSSSSWSLEEDWALADQIPRFTVGGDDSSDHAGHIRTFWAQLAASTPELSRKDTTQLIQRAHELNHTDHSKRRRLIFGESPPVLQQWQLDLDQRQAVGQTHDGRTIWISVLSVGRLKGDPFSNMDVSPSVFSLVPGGYLEAVGGKIYELGEPKNGILDNLSEYTSRSSTKKQEQEDKEAQSTEMKWWVPATTGTVSAMVASTVLSACIGYGAGLSIIQDESGPHHSSTTRSSYSSSPSYYSSQSQTSYEERRAQYESKVLREERLLQQVSQRLENDRQELNDLRRLTR